MIPSEIKNINSLQKFKTEIRKWASENCSCYLCRSAIQNLGSVDSVQTFDLFIILSQFVKNSSQFLITAAFCNKAVVFFNEKPNAF